jgi:beta-lactamase regulating signal transducer with metallopeptidase domain
MSDNLESIGWLLWLFGDWSLRWGVLIALVGWWFALRAPKHATSRLLVCQVVFFGGLLLPLVPHMWGPRRADAPAQVVAQTAPRATAPHERSIPPSRNPGVTMPQHRSAEDASGAKHAAADTTVDIVVQPSTTIGGRPEAQRWALSEGTLVALAIAWSLGLIIQSIRLFTGWLWLVRLRRAATAVDDVLLEQLAACGRELGLSRQVALATHPAVATPMFVGGLHPCVLVPANWPAVSADARRVVLLHELTHAARYDDVSKLIEELARTIFWFHPLVLWLLARIDREREEVCDAAVVRAGISPRDLAGVLVAFSRQIGPAGRRLALEAASLPFFRAARVKDRVTNLLGGQVMERFLSMPSRRRRLSVAGLVLAVLLIVGTFAVRAADPQPPADKAKPAAKEPTKTDSTTTTKTVPAKVEIYDEAKHGPLGIKGTLVDAAGKPIAGATVVATSREHGFPVELNLDLSTVAQSVAEGGDNARQLEQFAAQQLALRAVSDDQGRFHLLSSMEGLTQGKIVTLAVLTKDRQYFEVSLPVAAEATVHVPTVVDPAVKADKAAVGELTGVVVDEQGQPLADVIVDAYDWYPGNETKTGADGTFRLKRFDRNEKPYVRFRKPGYSPELNMRQPTGVGGLVIALGKNTFFEGKVRGPDGQPAKGAVIRANQGQRHMEGGVVTDIWTETKADDAGNYRLFVQPDEYAFEVKAEGVGTARLDKRLIPFGAHEKLDIELKPGVTFRAKIVDANSGEPVKGVKLWNWQHKGVQGISDEQGLVTISELLPGPFQFQVSLKGYPRWWSPDAISPWSKKSIDKPELHWQRNFDRLDFEMKPGMEPVTIEIEKGVQIRGRVVDPDGKPVAGATVAPALTGTGNSLTGDTRFSVRSNKDGTFEMELPASNEAQYNLVVHDGKYQQWRHWANGVLPPMKTTPGQEINDVEMRLTRGATVRGRVVDKLGKPLPYCEVRAHSADKWENRYYDPTVKTKEDGTFELPFVRAGEQYIQAAPFWLTAEQGPKQSSVKITLAEGQNVEGIELLGAVEK